MNSHDESVNIDTAQDDLPPQSLYRCRNYLFSADMNLVSMGSVAVISYCLMFIGGSLNYINNPMSYLVGSRKVDVNSLYLFIAVLTLIIAIIGITYIYNCYVAIKGEGGEEHFRPKAVGIFEYIKISFILLALGFFTYIQSIFYINAPSSLLWDKISLISYILMIISFMFGAAALVQNYQKNRLFNLKRKI